MTVHLDRDHLNDIMGDDLDAQKDLMSSFLKCADICLANLERALSETDQKKWREELHTLKGMSLNIGATQLSEESINAGKFHEDSFDKKRDCFKKIKASYALLQAEIDML